MKQVKAKPTFKHIPIELFYEKFNQEYRELYDAEERGREVAGYDKALDAGDVFIQQHPNFVAEFVRYRGDFLSSDREIVAFMFALCSFE